MAATTAGSAGLRIDPRTDPVFGLIYGDPKLGKTGDIVFAFPDAEWIAAPGALGVSVSVVGVPVTPERIHPSTNLKGVLSIVKAVCAKPPNQRPHALGIDDLTLIVDVTAREEEQNPNNRTRGGSLDGRRLWREVRNQVLDVRTEARRAGLHVIMNSHARGPEWKKDSEERETSILLSRGGPAIPGQMKEGLPAAVDIVFRAYKSEAAFTALWPVVVNAAANDDLWLTGNRLLPPVSPLPLNIGEIIRASGRTLPEPFPGHSERVEFIAGVFEKNEEKDWQALVKQVWPKLLAKYNNDGRRAYWIMRDALARAQIRMALKTYYAVPRLYSSSIEADF